MKNRVHSIMLIDDDKDDNFIHERVIRKSDAADIVIVKQNAIDALEYLESKTAGSTPPPPPDLILLDINMPRMNGWEFLAEYAKLTSDLKSRAVVVMLTTSDNPDDKIKASAHDNISELRIKPLTKEMLEEILDKNFGDRRVLNAS